MTEDAPTSPPEAAPQTLDFEAALRELEEVTVAVEGGDLPLEQALDRFERGLALAARCREALDSAQGRIEKLLEDGTLEAFEGFAPEA